MGRVREPMRARKDCEEVKDLIINCLTQVIKVMFFVNINLLIAFFPNINNFRLSIYNGEH